MGKKVIIAGASGMVGNIVLQQALSSKEVSEVISLVRKPLGKHHDKLSEVIITDFADYSSLNMELQNVDAAYFCIGVYTGAVDRDKFREITVDYPVELAKALHSKSPNATYCLLSGQGADRTEKSRMIFAKFKGIAENQLSKMGFEAFYTFRPGYIYPVTPREEPNFSYKLFRWLYPALKPIMGKNSSIKSTELGEAIFKAGILGAPKEELENKDILELL